MKPLAFALAIGFTVVAISAQQGGAPQPLPSTGTAVLTGTVVTDETNPRPVRRALVSVQMPSGQLARTTSTDDAGRFRIAQLPAGSYSAPRVNKGGYVSSVFGERRVGGIGTPITLVDGQKMNIEFRLKRGAVITGTVMDQGRPAVSTNVQAVPVRTVDGARVVSDIAYYGAGQYGSTDDRGIYRLYGLPPGDYVLMVSPGFVSSTVFPPRPVTEAEMQWAQQQVQGGYSTAGAPTAAGTPPPPPGRPFAKAPVYYPGTPVLSQAVPLSLAAGQERSGIDMELVSVPTARIEGLVTGPDGQPAHSAQLTLVPKYANSMSELESMLVMESMMLSRPVVTEGKFSMAAVRPGEYTITARGAARSDGPAAGAGRGGPAPAMNLWATADVSVNGTDVSGIELRLAPGIDINGRISFDGTAEKPADLSTVSVRLQAAPVPGVSVNIGVSPAVVGPDGAFTLKGVTPGRYLVYAYLPGSASRPTWVFGSARIGEIDAADVPFEVAPNRDAPDIAVTFTDKIGELSGTLLDGADKPTSQFSIIVFPADKAMWSQRSRRIRQPVRAATDGTFRFQNLLAGDYYLAALADFDQNDIYKPEFLEQVAAAAMKITIGEGEKKVQNLKISGGLR